jgi:PAS domain S-box-containing protein/putative nucleotidyltransferase with HDIG domain
MSTKLKVLLVEDNAADTELVLHEVRRAGYDPEWKQIETEPDFLAQIGQGWDIILADYNLPEFSGLRALELLRERDRDLPFIVVSGSIGEDKAVATIKAGANDYVMKDRLTRLGPVIERALGEALTKRERKRAEEALEAGRGLMRTLIDNLPDNIFIKDTRGNIILDNLAHRRILGRQELDEVIGKSDRDFFPPVLADRYMGDERRIVESGRPLINYEEPAIDQEGRPYWYLTTKVPVRDIRGNITALVGINRDITERKKAEAKLQETLIGLRNALSGIIQVLASVSEIRDPYTAGHQRRVADLARAIAQELGLAPDRVEGIRVAGLIHDIGKMSIPAEILSKPTLLSKIEYALIQSHVQIGHDILNEIEFAWPIAKLILQHHERMDGSGYPQQLKGDEILLESRILAVSDVIEAMASHRPYRAALGIDSALKEIDKDKGTLYDPAVVAACLTLFHKKGFTLKE